ncbi:MAG: hypothetical protein IJS89_08635 [Bacteroidaceae bacterium]|nr:hypothetical protein [Bacteroidaceae bacterium]
MKFLGCLLGFFVAIALWAFVVARQVVHHAMDMLRGGSARKEKDEDAVRTAGRTNAQGSRAEEGLFGQTERQYVDFEEVKDE